LGYVGDQIKVRPGYARNYLIPRGIAVEASSHNTRMLKHIVAGVTAKKAKLKGSADELAKKLEQAKLEYTLKMGERGKSFGAITTRDIETALKAQGFELDRRQIRFDPVRKPGEYKVAIKLHAEVTASIPVKVAVEAAPERKSAAPAEGAEKPKKARRKKGEAAEGEEAAPETAAPAEDASAEAGE
jgi:large subunit ribosomal protein L9